MFENTTAIYLDLKQVNCITRILITNLFLSQGSPGRKLILISPPMGASSPTTGKSPARRPRDGKKCRKVYGLEQRDLWCTQCKWKKACARFGSHATEPLGGGSQQQQQSLLISAPAISSTTTTTVVSSSLAVATHSAPRGLLPAPVAPTMSVVKAIKF